MPISAENKYSPTLDAFLNQGNNEKREVFIIADDGITNKGFSDLYMKDYSGFIGEIYEQNKLLRTSIQDDLALKFRSNVRHLPQFEKIGEGYLPIFKASVDRKNIDKLISNKNIKAIIPNLRIRTLEPVEYEFEDIGTNERKDGHTWGIKELRIPELWDLGLTGKGVKIGVLDTGVYGEHRALKNRVKDFVLIDQFGTIKRLQNNDTFDSGRHGTHVCGTIAGGTDLKTNAKIGVAPNADLYVASVLTGRSTLDTLFSGIGWCVQKGVRVINMSLGLSMYEPNLAQICKQLLFKYNILTVAAIGNENHGNSSSPGNTEYALGVGAVSSGYRRALSVAYFSSGASLISNEDIDGTNPIINKPDITAPGVEIYSCVPPEERISGVYEYAYFNGTSMACPHISGVAALIIQKNPEVSGKTLFDAIIKTADYKGQGKGPDNRWGNGFINPKKMLKYLEDNDWSIDHET